MEPYTVVFSLNPAFGCRGNVLWNQPQVSSIKILSFKDASWISKPLRTHVCPDTQVRGWSCTRIGPTIRSSPTSTTNSSEIEHEYKLVDPIP
jgi:hypothetical protein